MAAEFAEYDTFTQHVQGSRASYEAGEALHPTSTATTVRVARRPDPRPRTVPFAETKEALGGFYIVDAADLDEAIAYAAMIPACEARLDRGPPDLRLRERRGRVGARGRGARSAGADRSTRRLAVAADRGRARRRRPPVPRGVGPGRRDADPRPRRLRPGRGSGPGRLHHGPGDVAGPRGAGQPGGLDHDHGAQPGDRPAAPPQAPHREDRGPRRASRRSRRTCGPIDTGPSEDAMPIPDDRAAAHLHLLPSGPGDGRARGPDPAHARRADHARDRPGLPRPRADPRPAPGPGQAEDPRRRDPVSRAARRAPAGAARRRPARPLPRLQRGLRRHLRATRSSAASCAPRRSG